jgi:hypothetical protein
MRSPLLKIVSSFLIASNIFISVSFLFNTNTAEAAVPSFAPIRQIPAPVPIENKPQADKETGITLFGITLTGVTLDSIMIRFMKGVLEKIADDTVDWINTGFEGNPAFATDPEAFFLSTTRAFTADFSRSITTSSACSTFKTAVEKAIRDSAPQADTNSRTPRTYEGSCELKAIATDIDRFIEGDFSQGGWDGWFALTQERTNNPYGTTIDAAIKLAELQTKVIEIEGVKLDWGRGAFSWSECEKMTDGICTQRTVKTPGAVIESQLEKTLSAEISELELADELDEIISALTGQLINRVFSSGQGLLSGGRYTNPNPPAGSRQLAVTCQGEPSSVLVNEDVTWTATVIAPGIDLSATPPTFLWGGDAPLGGQTSNPVIVQYTTPNKKSGRVTVTAGSLTATAICQPTTIDVANFAPLVVSCYPEQSQGTVGEYITWVATVAGGSGTLKFPPSLTWGGTDTGRIGDPPWGVNQVSRTGTGKNTVVTIRNTRLYSQPGEKEANFTVFDLDKTVTVVNQKRCDSTVFIY